MQRSLGHTPFLSLQDLTWPGVALSAAALWSSLVRHAALSEAPPASVGWGQVRPHLCSDITSTGQTDSPVQWSPLLAGQTLTRAVLSPDRTDSLLTGALASSDSSDNSNSDNSDNRENSNSDSDNRDSNDNSNLKITRCLLRLIPISKITHPQDQPCCVIPMGTRKCATSQEWLSSPPPQSPADLFNSASQLGHGTHTHTQTPPTSTHTHLWQAPAANWHVYFLFLILIYFLIHHSRRVMTIDT